MDIPCIYLGYAVHNFLAPDVSIVQGDRKTGSGAISLDLELLKQCRVSAVAQERTDKVWLEYAFRKHHPVLQYLPTKLAEWIGENMQDELGFPDKKDPNNGVRLS